MEKQEHLVTMVWILLSLLMVTMLMECLSHMQCSTQTPLDICSWSSLYNYVTNSRSCPCKQNSVAVVPPFVGNDYYCESARLLCCGFPYDDVLWDGQCSQNEALCCAHPNMPWFIKTLNETTTENIELRICNNNPILDLIELFVR